MPQPLWHHVCEDNTGILIEHPECCICLGAGVLDGWYLTAEEAAACYEYVFGMRSGGPHRALADARFRGMRRPCSGCGGEAIITFKGGTGWARCPQCEGTGGLWISPQRDVEDMRKAILERFPDAGVSAGALSALAAYGDLRE